MDHMILSYFFRGRSHHNSLLLSFISVAYGLHYCVVRHTLPQEKEKKINQVGIKETNAMKWCLNY